MTVCQNTNNEDSVFFRFTRIECPFEQFVNQSLEFSIGQCRLKFLDTNFCEVSLKVASAFGKVCPRGCLRPFPPLDDLKQNDLKQDDKIYVN